MHGRNDIGSLLPFFSRVYFLYFLEWWATAKIENEK